MCVMCCKKFEKNYKQTLTELKTAKELFLTIFVKNI